MNEQDLAILMEVARKRVIVQQVANDEQQEDRTRMFAIQLLFNYHHQEDELLEKWELEANQA